MSTLYERWVPAVGDRVRVTLHNETGAEERPAQTGTIVEIAQEAPYVRCTVEYDGGGQAGARRGAHLESELEPLDAPPGRGPTDAPRASGAGASVGRAGPADWEPTVGDRVRVGDGRAATITAIEERGGETICEVEYDHCEGEVAEPRRGSHPVGELRPTREPSADALDGHDRARHGPAREPGVTPI